MWSTSLTCAHPSQKLGFSSSETERDECIHANTEYIPCDSSEQNRIQIMRCIYCIILERERERDDVGKWEENIWKWKQNLFLQKTTSYDRMRNVNTGKLSQCQFIILSNFPEDSFSSPPHHRIRGAEPNAEELLRKR